MATAEERECLEEKETEESSSGETEEASFQKLMESFVKGLSFEQLSFIVTSGFRNEETQKFAEHRLAMLYADNVEGDFEEDRDAIDEACCSDKNLEDWFEGWPAASPSYTQYLDEVILSLGQVILTRDEVIDCVGVDQEPLDNGELAAALDPFADDGVLEEMVEHP